jgi:FixJ family two-component response regulator
MQLDPVISVVDDDEAVRASIVSLLRSVGYSVYSFASAEEFLESPQLRETLCLISDVQMPGLSGIELQRRLLAGGHRMAIIFVTSYSDRAVRDKAMREGAVAFMDKALASASLIPCLERTLKDALAS